MLGIAVLGPVVGPAVMGPLLAQTASSEPKRDPRIDSVLDDLAKVRSIYQTAISPDGAMIAWVVAGEDGGKPSGSEIEVAPLSSSDKPTRVTAGTKDEFCDENSIAWAPDSKPSPSSPIAPISPSPTSI